MRTQLSFMHLFLWTLWLVPAMGGHSPIHGINGGCSADGDPCAASFFQRNFLALPKKHESDTVDRGTFLTSDENKEASQPLEADDVDGMPEQDEDEHQHKYTVEVDMNGDRVVTWSNASLDKVDMTGCRFVFLDLGSNVGVHVREVFEAWKYPKSMYLPLFDEHIGKPSDRNASFRQSGVCVFGFEANPAHVSRLNALEKAYTAKGWKVSFFAPFVVSDSKGKVTLYGVGEEPSVNDWGVSAASNKITDTQTEASFRNTNIVPAFSLDDWVRRHIVPHRDHIEYVLAKMDIEGSEFAVLNQMSRVRRRAAGGSVPVSLCQKKGIDLMTVEWHDDKIPKDCVLCSAEEVKEAINAMDCKDTKPFILSDLDDETYLIDNEPLSLL